MPWKTCDKHAYKHPSEWPCPICNLKTEGIETERKITEMPSKKNDLVMPVGKCYETISRFGADLIEDFKYKLCRIVTFDYTMNTCEIVRVYSEHGNLMRIAYDDCIEISKDISQKYKLLKVVSGRGLIGDGACSSAMEIFLRAYGYNQTLGQIQFNDAINFANINTGWIEYLLEQKIIEEIKDEWYPVGGTYLHDGAVYILSQIDVNSYQMIAIPTSADQTIGGKRWSDIFSAIDVPGNKLSRTQFELLIGGSFRDWVEVEGRFTFHKKK